MTHRRPFLNASSGSVNSRHLRTNFHRFFLFSYFFRLSRPPLGHTLKENRGTRSSTSANERTTSVTNVASILSITDDCVTFNIDWGDVHPAGSISQLFHQVISNLFLKKKANPYNRVCIINTVRCWCHKNKIAPQKVTLKRRRDKPERMRNELQMAIVTFRSTCEWVLCVGLTAGITASKK